VGISTGPFILQISWQAKSTNIPVRISQNIWVSLCLCAQILAATQIKNFGHIGPHSSNLNIVKSLKRTQFQLHVYVPLALAFKVSVLCKQNNFHLILGINNDYFIGFVILAAVVMKSTIFYGIQRLVFR
jgi:hypothetical protein